ncbi:unnamed protein product [Ambrosiozyma monospora]|uniref:Unnamed protein product n=1 Tax=Ambrosiozyma monospora TaxID=43982 RepID=A0A9W6T598_AMBMO|nr:unnamed protein product [Ambrosiozyma monospora]
MHESTSIKSNGSKKFGLFNSFKMKKDIENAQENALKVDVWSLGVTFFFLFFERFPFYNENEFRLFNDIVNNKIVYPESLDKVNIFRKLWEPKKLDASYNKQLLSYFNNLLELLQKMLNKDPSSRITIKSVRSHQFFRSFTESKDYQQFQKFNHSFVKNAKTIPDTEGYNIRNSDSRDLISDHFEAGNATGLTTRLKGPFAKLFNLTPSNSTQSLGSQLTSISIFTVFQYAATEYDRLIFCISFSINIPLTILSLIIR